MPLFGSAVFQQLYTLADTVIAGKFAEETALTAIGASNSIVNILMAVALGANAGCAVLASRFFGSKDNAKVKSTVFTALISFAALSVVLMTAGVLTCRIVLRAMNTPSEALDASVTYLNIYYYGLPFLILYNLGTGTFSALGDSRTPFIFLVISSVSNIVLDYFMVQPWGVAGVAWATFIAQGAACILTLVFLFRRVSRLQSEERAVPFSYSLLKLLVLLAIPVRVLFEDAAQLHVRISHIFEDFAQCLVRVFLFPDRLHDFDDVFGIRLCVRRGIRAVSGKVLYKIQKHIHFSVMEKRIVCRGRQKAYRRRLIIFACGFGNGKIDLIRKKQLAVQIRAVNIQQFFHQIGRGDEVDMARFEGCAFEHMFVIRPDHARSDFGVKQATDTV